MKVHDVKPGMRIRVTQQIRRRGGDWQSQVEGTILSAALKQTGSWYAHSKRDKYWLVRLELLKDDQEITRLTLDHNTQIAVLDE